MNKLPLEIQDKIWHIYYKDIYYDSVVIKINDTNRKFIELDKYCYNMYCSFCIYSNIDDEISEKKLIDRCIIYNNFLLDMYNDNFGKLYLKRFNFITNHIVKILDSFGISNIYTKFTKQFNLIGAYLCIKGNYNPKFEKYLCNNLIVNKNI